MNMPNNAVLAVIVNYESEEQVMRLYNTCLSDLPIDVVVVDNSQSSRLDDWTSEYRINYVQTQENSGYATGNNIAIENYSYGYKYIWILNPDIQPFDEQVLDSLLSKMSEHQNLGIVAPTIFDQYENRYELPSRFEDILRTFGILPELTPIGNDLVCVDHAPGSAMLIRKEVIDDIGLLNEDFFLYVEDTEYCYRARQHGYVVAIDRDAELVHQSEEAGMKFSSDYQMYYRTRNRFLLAKKRFETYGRLLYVVLVSLMIARDLFHSIRAGRYDLLIPIAEGVFDGLEGVSGRKRYLV